MRLGSQSGLDSTGCPERKSVPEKKGTKIVSFGLSELQEAEKEAHLHD